MAHAVAYEVSLNSAGHDVPARYYNSTKSVGFPFFFQILMQNLRLPLPDWTPDSLRAVLQACWAADPQLRPTFEDLQHWTKTLHSSDILAIPEGVDPTANPLPRELLSMR